MNQMLIDFARDYLKRGLALLNDGHREKFRLMYGYSAGKDWEVVKVKPIEEIVDSIPEAQLSWAMEQVKNTLSNNPPQEKTYEHSPVCNGDRRKPPGTNGACCSCLNPLRRFTKEELNTYMSSRMKALKTPSRREEQSEPHSYKGNE